MVCPPTFGMSGPAIQVPWRVGLAGVQDFGCKSLVVNILLDASAKFSGLRILPEI
jgi:hypothetical protein